MKTNETPAAAPVPQKDIPPMEPGRFWERPGTFSILAFKGDVRAQLRELLPKLGYSVQSTQQERASAMEINDKIMFTDDGAIKKAYWFAGGFTVILDPEMVMSHEDALDSFCKENSTSMVSATWERVSRSAIAVEISPTGERKSSYLIEGGVPEGAPQPAHTVLVESPIPPASARSLSPQGCL